MIKRIVSVFDSGTGVWSPPMLALTRVDAERSVLKAVKDTGLPFSEAPEYYSFFELGTFDDCRAEFSIHQAPVRITTAVEALAKMKGVEVSQ